MGVERVAVPSGGVCGGACEAFVEVLAKRLWVWLSKACDRGGVKGLSVGENRCDSDHRGGVTQTDEAV